MVRAAARVRPDALAHLGDNIRDAAALSAAFPDLPLYSLSGNCDYSSPVPDTLEFLVGPVPVLATHGHRYGVKYGTDSLLNAARFSGAGLVLYGHTHIPDCRNVCGIEVLNPGSAGMGRRPTFGVAEINGLGGIVCRVLDI